MVDAANVPDAVFERLLGKLPAGELESTAAEVIAKGDHRLALVLILAALARHEGRAVALPTLLRAAAGAEALLRGEA